MKEANFFWIVGVSLILAAYLAYVQDVRRKPAYLPAATPDQVTGIPLIRLAEAAALWREAGTLFLDVRTDGDFAAGHIQGAVHLPDEEDFDKRLAALRPRLDRAEALVVYCKSVDCGKSLWAALRLKQAGLTQVKIYPGGWNEWVDDNQPRSTAEQ